MPKTQNAFALRGFDVEEYLRIKLLEYGLKKNALDNLDADLDDFDDMQRARKAYAKLNSDLQTFRGKIIRHTTRLLKYSAQLLQAVARNDSDDYFISIFKPHNKRLDDLSRKYSMIDMRLIQEKDITDNAIEMLDQYQRSYYMKVFATRLRAARKAAGLTQAELAAQLGVKRSSYGLYEQARNEPNVSVLALLSRLLNRSADWLLGLS